MYDVLQFVNGGLLVHQSRHFLDDVACMRPEEVASENPSILGISDDFAVTVGLSHGNCLAICSEYGF